MTSWSLIDSQITNGGYSVSFDPTGTIIAVGDPDNSITRVYHNINDTWAQLGTNITGEIGDRFGHSVSLLRLYEEVTLNNTIIVIGAPNKAVSNSAVGCTQIYQYNVQQNIWQQLGSDINGDVDGDQSGYSVSIAENANIYTVAIGAPGANNGVGLVKIYNSVLDSSNNLTWANVQSIQNTNNMGFGFSLALTAEGSGIIIGSPFSNNNKGTVNFYSKNNTSWDLFFTLNGDDDGEQFGYNVNLSDNPTRFRFAVSSPYKTVNSLTNAGQTKVYDYDGTSVLLGNPINGITSGERCGHSIALNFTGTIIAVCSPFKTINNNTEAGHIRLFEFTGGALNTNGTWNQISEFSGSNENEQFGLSISLTEDSASIIQKLNITGAPTFESYTRLAIGSNNSGVSLYQAQLTPIGNICFVAGTPVLTDQGNIPIERINKDYHTIRNKPILAVTQSIYATDKYLVALEKDCLGKNVPLQQTIVSMRHRIFYNNKMVTAAGLIENLKIKGIKYIPYKGEILYNILLKNHDNILVNNLVCESLDPISDVAKLYTAIDKIDHVYRVHFINWYNENYISSR